MNSSEGTGTDHNFYTTAVSSPSPMPIKVGCSGWSYPEWVGPFYPQIAKARDQLRLYSDVFDVVEINSTFYRMPSKRMVDRWREETPDGFIFTAKFPREITHEKKLVQAEEETRRFLSLMERLEKKQGPLLLQFPPSFTFEKGFGVLQEFLDSFSPEARFCVEPRHISWYRDEFYGSLRSYDVSLCWSLNQYCPVIPVSTANYLYIRFIGDRELDLNGTTQRDRSKEMNELWKEIGKHIDTMDYVLTFFNNHFAGFGPASVNDMREIAGLSPLDWSTLGQKGQQKLDMFRM